MLQYVAWVTDSACVQFITFMKLDVLASLISDSQPWATLWMSQPAEVPGDVPAAPPKAWAANVEYGNYSQVRSAPLFIGARS